MMNKSFTSVSLLSALMLTACVTINIYFPAAAAEKVADEIIQGIQEDNKTEPAVEPKAGLSEWQLFAYQGIDNVLNVIFTAAHAAEANLDVDTAEIRQLRAAMKGRFSSLQPFYSQGYIGIRADGMLAVKDAGKIPLQDRNKVNKLVDAENNDRNKLYQAIANANGHPDWFNQIKSTFAGSWVNNAGSGWWYQTSNGSWKQK